LLHTCEGAGQVFAIQVAVATFAALVVKPDNPLPTLNANHAVFEAVIGWGARAMAPFKPPAPELNRQG